MIIIKGSHRTFVEPEMLPSSICDQIACPAVSYLVCHNTNEGPVTSQQSGGDKGEAGVLHTPIGEGGG